MISRSSSIWGTTEQFSTLCLETFQLLAVSVHFFAEVASIEMRFSIQIYFIITFRSNSISGTIKVFMTDLCPLDLK